MLFLIKKTSFVRQQKESTRTTILHVEVPKGVFNWEQERSFSLDWELVIRDHSDDLNQLWGRIHGSVDASILDGPGEVSWVGRNSATKVLKHGEM